MAAVHSEGALQMADLPSALQYHVSSPVPDLSEVLEEHAFTEFVIAPKLTMFSISDSEKVAIVRAVAATQGDRTKAARLLQIGRTTLYRKMKQYGID